MVWPFDILDERVSKLEYRLANVEGQLASIQLAKILKKLEVIMSKISEYGDAVRGYFTDLNASLTGLTSDVAEMKALIEKLQNSPGEISPEDQKTLDELQALAKGAAATAKELDERTPPPAVPAG